MMNAASLLLALMLILNPFKNPLHAQVNGDSFPHAVSAAHTIAIVDDTHQPGVAQGAAEAIKAWGRFTVVDDPDNADLTLRFDKEKDRSGHDTQNQPAQNQPAQNQPTQNQLTPSGAPNDNSSSYGYGLSFSSSIHMKAYLKDGDSPFYTTKSDDSKKKAGTACVSDFRSAVASHAR